MALYVVRKLVDTEIWCWISNSCSQLIVLHRPPWEAFQPISELEFMSFRDGMSWATLPVRDIDLRSFTAGRGKSDFNLSIHDCLWGFWKVTTTFRISYRSAHPGCHSEGAAEQSH